MRYWIYELRSLLISLLSVKSSKEILENGRRLVISYGRDKVRQSVKVQMKYYIFLFVSTKQIVLYSQELWLKSIFQNKSLLVCVHYQDCLWAVRMQTHWAISPKQTLVTVGNMAMKKKKTGLGKWVFIGRGWMGWWWWWGGERQQEHFYQRSEPELTFQSMSWGLEKSMHLNPPIPACLRREKHCLGEIRPLSSSSQQGTANRHTIHMYSHVHGVTEMYWS